MLPAIHGINSHRYPVASGAFDFSAVGGYTIDYYAHAISGSYNDDDAVSSWADESGNYTATNGTADQQPIYKTGITPSGQNVVRFDGTNDDLQDTNVIDWGTAHTRFYVVNITHDNSGTKFVARDSTADFTLVTRTDADMNFGINNTVTSLSSGDYVPNVVLGNWQIIGLRADFNTGSGAILNVHTNRLTTHTGAPDASGTGTNDTTPILDSYIRLLTSTGYQLTDLARMIAYDAYLSDSDFNDVMGALGTLFGITVST